LPADVDLVVGFFVGFERAREDFWTRLGIEYARKRRHGAVVKIRRRCPDAVERRRLIAHWGAHRTALFLLTKPAFVVKLPDRRRQSFEAIGISADLVDGNDLVGISPLLAVSSVAAGASIVEDLVTGLG